MPQTVEVLTGAIHMLVAAVAAMTTILTGLGVYIWQSHKLQTTETFNRIEAQVTKIGSSLELMAKELYDRTNVLDHRMTAVESVCSERHENMERSGIDRRRKQ